MLMFNNNEKNDDYDPEEQKKHSQTIHKNRWKIMKMRTQNDFFFFPVFIFIII